MTIAFALRAAASPIRNALAVARWKPEAAGPAPQSVKQALLARYTSSTRAWIETGTYLGETAAYLARRARSVTTIEPCPQLAARARRRLHGQRNITVIAGTSEEALPQLLPSLSGEVSFWLDGHYSGGLTHRGPLVTPIEAELSAIGQHLCRLERPAIFIDDVRLFGRDPEYPAQQVLTEWAEAHRLSWHIEADIFVAGC